MRLRRPLSITLPREFTGLVILMFMKFKLLHIWPLGSRVLKYSLVSLLLLWLPLQSNTVLLTLSFSETEEEGRRDRSQNSEEPDESVSVVIACVALAIASRAWETLTGLP